MPSLLLRRTGSSEDLAQAMKIKEDEIDRILSEQRTINTAIEAQLNKLKTVQFMSVESDAPTVKFVCVSDTHSHHAQLRPPDGDVLIHAGDFSYTGSMKEVQSFCDWLDKQPHKIKIVIAGNHDVTMQSAFYEKEYYRWHKERENHRAIQALMFQHCVYLEDSAVVIDGIKIWGSPWQPWFLSWAFNLQRGRELLDKWSLIPNDTDVLVTHGPPYGQGDRIKSRRGGFEHVGCEDLMRVVRVVAPKYHVFGHVHEAAGISKDKNTTYINACICTIDYKPWGRPFVFELPKRNLVDEEMPTIRSTSAPLLAMQLQ
jgi:predicted phosphohydrolase